MTRFFLLLAFGILAHTNVFSESNFLPLSVNIDSLHNPNCFSPAGYVSAIATGGNPGYTYEWSNGEVGPVLTNVVAGDYKVIVTDQDGTMVDLLITITDDFAVPAAEAGPPVIVQCTNTQTTINGSGSTGPGFAYQWVASNGGHILSGATSLSPVIDQAGTFRLTVTDTNNGCTAADETIVGGQNAPPMAMATGGVLNCTSNTVTLGIVYSALHTTFVWQGPGAFVSHLVNPVVSIAGNYVFTLTDTITGCINKSTAVVTSNFVAPNADASGGGTVTCAQPSVQLNGISTTPGATYSWTGPNGFSSTQQNPAVGSGGTYTLTVHNPVNGCTASDAVTVGSNLTAPTGSATVTGTITCIVPAVQLSGSTSTPNATFGWTGPNNFVSNLQNPTSNKPGLYTLTVTNPVNGCTGTATVIVQQNIATPNVSATGGVKTCSLPSVTLAGGSTTPGATYSWTGPNGFTSTQQNPNVSFVGTYVLKVTNPQNGCTATATATVSQNVTPPNVTATTGTITCTNPLTQITTTSTPAGLNYSWTGPNNFTSSQQNPLVGVAGYYYVTATNPSNGCTNTTSVFTFANNTPPFSYAGEDKSLNCFFTSILINGSFSSNGPNYTYKWTTLDGNITGGETTLYPNVNLEGTYVLKVTNTLNGCTDLDSMVVTQSAPVNASITQTTPVYCSGGSNGSATVSASGGSGNFNYHWSNGNLTPTISNLNAGTYTVTLTDTEGCSATATATINQLILTATIGATPQTIPGVNNGTATVSGGGGTAPYTAKWSTGAVTLSISGLAPGPYSVTVTDAHGCTIVKTTNVNVANCTMSGTIAGVNVTCFGAANGSATVNLIGAANPVTYAWSNGGSTKTVNSLAPGTFTVTATDAAGCQVVQTVQVTGPQQLVAAVTVQNNVLCPNSANGSITVGVTGGKQPYTYHWSNNSASNSISGLAPGNYALTVTDGNGCTSTLSAQINSPEPITITILSKTDVGCPGANTGAISIQALGGLAPYNYFWSNGSTNAAISGLAAGSYSLTVTDANGCPKSLSTQILVNDQAPPVLVLKNATVDLGNNGNVSISPSLFDNGSTDNCGIANWTVTPNTFNCSQAGTHTVTITATDPGGNTSTGTAIVTVVDNIVPSVTCPANITTGSCNPFVQFNMPAIDDNCQINPAQLVQLSGLPSGTSYPTGNTHQSFQYTDPAGNTGQCSFEVFVAENVTLNTGSSPASCSGACDGTVFLTQTSGGTFNLSWSNGQNGLTLTGLCPGVYTASITDAYGCVQTKTAEVTVVDVQAPVLTCPANIVGSYCSGSIAYNPPVVTDNCQIIQSNLQLVSGLASGAFFPVGTSIQNFMYTDGGGNVAQCSFTVNISGPSTQTLVTQNAICGGVCNGTATLSVNGDASPFNIQWSNGQTGTTATNLCSGIYTYVITDNAGCVQTGSASITQPPALVVLVEGVIDDLGGAGSGSIQINVSGGVSPYTFAWTRNGQFYASMEDLNNLLQGQYAVVITDANGCTSSMGPLTVSNTVIIATKNPEWAQSMSLQPNPASDVAQLVFEAPLGQAAILRVCDMSGRVVSTQEISATDQVVSIDVATLQAGVWLLQIQSENGETAIRKLAVTR